MAAVKAAITSGPKELHTLCIISKPKDKTANCIAIGIAIFRCSFINLGLYFHVLRLGVKIEYLRLMYIKQATTDIEIAITVPVADPATPILRTQIKNKLSKILIVVVKIKKYNGDLLSPTARISPDKRLKNTIIIIPAERIQKRTTVQLICFRRF